MVPPDDPGCIEADARGTAHALWIRQPITKSVFCLATDFANNLTKLKASCPKPVSDEDYRTAKKDQLGSPLN
jgi:hypothetical protein